MRTFLLTGLIGSGKSAVADCLRRRGLPVYDSDTVAKELYDKVPGLLERIEAALDCGTMRLPDGKLDRSKLAGVIFSDASKKAALEGILYPALLEDFMSWRKGNDGRGIVFLESAVAASCPVFDGVYDAVVEVKAASGKRLERVLLRNPELSEEEIRRRMASQTDPSESDYVIENDGDLGSLENETDKLLKTIMKTDLARILSVAGQHGLFHYVAQARSGAIAESLSDGKRTVFDMHSRITSLADIAIYTSEGEMKLKDVFLAMKGVLGEELAPTSKASADELKALFLKAVPNYDADRFYVSHMKKVVDWYNEIAKYASFEFAEEGEEETAAAEE